MAIALITDFGLIDPYAGIMKGVILSIDKNATVIDVTHNINRHDILQAAFILKKSYGYFPKGTVFAAVVDPGVGSKRRAITVESAGYFFIGPDNGLLYPVFKDDNNARVFEITNREYMLENISNTFHGRDIFAPAAAKIAEQKSASGVGDEIFDITKLNFPHPEIREKYIKGNVVFADIFGNLITDIDMSLLSGRVVKEIKVGNQSIKKLSLSYSESGEGELLAIEGSYGMLEIAANMASAADIIQGEKGNGVEIIF